MRMTLASLTVVAVSLILVSSAVAQTNSPRRSTATTAFDSPTQGQYAGSYGKWGYHASTAAEGYLTGSANLTRAQGERNYLDSMAMINIEEARGLYMDNMKKNVVTYFEKRKLNTEYRNAERGPQRSASEMAQMARDASPRRLTSYQLEVFSGRINWPDVLQSTEFDASRSKLNDLFAERDVEAAGLGTKNHREVTRVARQMEEELKENIKTFSPSEYAAAKSFIQSLSYESRFIPGVEGIASR